MVPSKVTRLDNQDNLTSNKANLVSSRGILLYKLDKLIFHKVN